MHYFDCYLAPVPTANRAAYEKLAAISATVLQEYGALRITECWLDGAGPDASAYHADSARLDAAAYGDFARAAGAQSDETVVLSWVEWPDKATRDAGMARVTSDPRMKFDDQRPVFDGRRLIAGGFVPMLAVT